MPIFIFIITILLQIFFIYTVRAENFEETVKNVSKINGYNTKGLVYIKEEETFSANFTSDNCKINIESRSENGIKKKHVTIVGPSNAVSAKCLQQLREKVLAKSLNANIIMALEKEEKIISNDYTFSHYYEDKNAYNLKAEKGRINFILYDCQLDSTHCADLKNEINN